MDTRQKIAALIAAQKAGIIPPEEACIGTSTARRRERNLRKANDDLGLELRSNQETKRPRAELAGVTTQAVLNESYKAKKSVSGIEAAMLFERYGDVMGVVDKHPTFRKVTLPVAEGGWGVYPQALTNACKQHSVDGDLGTGVLKVLEAIRYTANYPAARNKAAFFWAVLRNGMRKEA
jgi:hypothetical protein